MVRHMPISSDSRCLRESRISQTFPSVPEVSLPRAKRARCAANRFVFRLEWTPIRQVGKRAESFFSPISATSTLRERACHDPSGTILRPFGNTRDDLSGTGCRHIRNGPGARLVIGTGVASFVRAGNFLTESIKTSNHVKSSEIRRRVEEGAEIIPMVARPPVWVRKPVGAADELAASGIERHGQPTSAFSRTAPDGGPARPVRARSEVQGTARPAPSRSAGGRSASPW